VKLRDVLMDVPVLSPEIPGDIDILGIAYSSKEVRPGSLFAALKGEKSDGMDFVAEAETKGAAVVLSEWPKPATVRLSWIQAADARESMAWRLRTSTGIRR